MKNAQDSKQTINTDTKPEEHQEFASAEYSALHQQGKIPKHNRGEGPPVLLTPYHAAQPDQVESNDVETFRYQKS